jgi:hypothetical protein
VSVGLDWLQHEEITAASFVVVFLLLLVMDWHPLPAQGMCSRLSKPDRSCSVPRPAATGARASCHAAWFRVFQSNTP